MSAKGFLDELAENLDIGPTTMAGLIGSTWVEYEKLRHQPLCELADETHPMWGELWNFAAHRAAGCLAAQRELNGHLRKARKASIARRAELVR